MADLQVPTEEFAYGRSKIFIRNPRTVHNSYTQLKMPYVPSTRVFFPASFDFSCVLQQIKLCLNVLRLNPVCTAALFSHSKMFVKQGGLHFELSLWQLTCNCHSENTWFHLAIPSNMGNERLYSTLAGQSTAPAYNVRMDFFPTQQKTKHSLK